MSSGGYASTRRVWTAGVKIGLEPRARRKLDELALILPYLLQMQKQPPRETRQCFGQRLRDQRRERIEIRPGVRALNEAAGPDLIMKQV